MAATSKGWESQILLRMKFSAFPNENLRIHSFLLVQYLINTRFNELRVGYAAYGCTNIAAVITENVTFFPEQMIFKAHLCSLPYIMHGKGSEGLQA